MSDDNDNDNDNHDLLVEAWKTTVAVQQHFNDIELRIRSFALSFLGVVLGAAAVAVERASGTSLGRWIAIVGLVGWIGFYMMDRHWYHRLLMGSVKHGLEVEKILAETTKTQAFALTKAIGDESPVPIHHWVWGWRFDVHSKDKLDAFYGLGIVMLMLFILVPAFQPATAKPPQPEQHLRVSVDATDSSVLLLQLRPFQADSSRPKTEIDTLAGRE